LQHGCRGLELISTNVYNDWKNNQALSGSKTVLTCFPPAPGSVLNKLPEYPAYSTLIVYWCLFSFLGGPACGIVTFQGYGLKPQHSRDQARSLAAGPPGNSLCCRFTIFSCFGLEDPDVLVPVSSCRRELSYFGVKVAVIEPGFFMTNMTAAEVFNGNLQAAWQQASPEVKDLYGDAFVANCE